MSADGFGSPGSSGTGAGPLQVLLNVYDVAQQGDSKLIRLNNLVGPKGLGLGGVFHGAIVLGSVEFSFGFCEQGTGVYAVKAGSNPMYTFRETIDLGPTKRSMAEIRDIIQQLKQEWPGSSYDLLYRNCCHFCVDLAARLDVGPVPGWLNRLASGAAVTINITQDTVKTVQEFGAEVGRFWSKTIAAASQQQQQIAEKLQQQQSNWRNQQQQQQRGVDGAGTPRSVQLAGSASQAGQQLWSGLSQAGQQLRATTSKLAQAAAAKTGGSGPRFGSISLGSMALGSSSAGSNYAVLDGEGQQPQQERNGSSSGPTQMGAAAAGDASNSAGAAHLQRTHGVLGSGDRGSLLAGLGAQPKLSKQYRLSGGGPSASLGAGGDPSTAAAAAAAAAAASSGGEGRLQPCVGEGEGLLPFLSVEEGDPFVSLVGEDDGPDDEQQRAAVENAVLHSPAGAAVAAAAPK